MRVLRGARRPRRRCGSSGPASYLGLAVPGDHGQQRRGLRAACRAAVAPRPGRERARPAGPGRPRWCRLACREVTPGLPKPLQLDHARLYAGQRRLPQAATAIEGQGTGIAAHGGVRHVLHRRAHPGVRGDAGAAGGSAGAGRGPPGPLRGAGHRGRAPTPTPRSRKRPKPSPALSAPSPEDCAAGSSTRSYPRSFADSDGDGVGDLPAAIIGTSNYLHRLGVDVVWLSPVYRSPDGRQRLRHQRLPGHDPLSGTLADLDELDRRAARPRHEAGHGPGGQPHLRRAPLVHRVPLEPRQP